MISGPIPGTTVWSADFNEMYLIPIPQFDDANCAVGGTGNGSANGNMTASGTGNANGGAAQAAK